MAHNFRIKPVPHKNKDGSESKSKKDYVVIDRKRKGTRIVGIANSQKAANQMIEDERAVIIWNHANKNPHDQHFLNKHGMRVDR